MHIKHATKNASDQDLFPEGVDPVKFKSTFAGSIEVSVHFWSKLCMTRRAQDIESQSDRLHNAQTIESKVLRGARKT